MSDINIWLRFVLAVLATWRVTHLIAREDGPGDIIVRLRMKLGTSFWGSLMDCFYCLSIWVAAPFTLFVCSKPLDLLLTWLALSGAACLLERFGNQPVVIEAAPPIIEEDINHKKEQTHNGMLRTEASGHQQRATAGDEAGSDSAGF